MKSIKKLVDRIDEEICDAQKYAEAFVEEKAKGHMDKANKYKSMSEDELKHATYVHEFAVEEIQQIQTVYKAPAEMMEKWERSHERYVERAAWVRQMLAM